MSSLNKDTIIARDIHCPYCNSDSALVISRAESKKVSLQTPAFGLKTVLRLLYLSILYVWIYGYKLIEARKQIEHVTYGFCPICGNAYSMAPPESVKEETEEPNFYRIHEGKVFNGMCKGISEYANIPLLWVRIMTAILGLSFIGALLYFFIGLCIPYKNESDTDTTPTEEE